LTTDMVRKGGFKFQAQRVIDDGFGQHLAMPIA